MGLSTKPSSLHQARLCVIESLDDRQAASLAVFYARAGQFATFLGQVVPTLQKGPALLAIVHEGEWPGKRFPEGVVRGALLAAPLIGSAMGLGAPICRRGDAAKFGIIGALYGACLQGLQERGYPEVRYRVLGGEKMLVAMLQHLGFKPVPGDELGDPVLEGDAGTMLSALGLAGIPPSDPLGPDFSGTETLGCFGGLTQIGGSGRPLGTIGDPWDGGRPNPYASEPGVPPDDPDGGTPPDGGGPPDGGSPSEPGVPPD